MSSVTDFIKNNITLCVCTLGLAIVGYLVGRLGHRLVTWIREKCARTEQLDAAAAEVLRRPTTPLARPLHTRVVEPAPPHPIPAAPLAESPPLVFAQRPAAPIPPPIAPAPVVPPSPLVRVAITPNLAHFANITLPFLASGNQEQKNKYVFLRAGLQRLQALGAHFANFSIVRFTDPSMYDLRQVSTPEFYLKRPSPMAPCRPLEVTEAYYTYIEEPPHILAYHVDFANADLGGGLFTRGFAQEETAFCGMVGGAAYLAENLDRRRLSTIYTRLSTLPNARHVERSGFGSPNPQLLLDLHRIQALDRSAYGREFVQQDHPEAHLLGLIRPIDPPTPVNFLAIAAPRLEGGVSRATSCSLTNLLDIANTLFAGFQLAAQEAGGRPFRIHSGPIGCGAFHNDKEAVFLLHMLVGAHLGIEPVMHAYSAREATAYTARWDRLFAAFEAAPSLYARIELLSQDLIASPRHAPPPVPAPAAEE